MIRVSLSPHDKSVPVTTRQECPCHHTRVFCHHTTRVTLSPHKGVPVTARQGCPCHRTTRVFCHHTIRVTLSPHDKGVLSPHDKSDPVTTR